MHDERVGSAFRAVRLRRGWRQQDVADRAAVSRAFVSLVERGHLASVSLATLRRVAGALDIRLDVVPRWRGGELDRLVNAGHAALHESVARHLGSLPGWLIAPEVSFSIYGERGVIDIWPGTSQAEACSSSSSRRPSSTSATSSAGWIASTDSHPRSPRSVAGERPP